MGTTGLAFRPTPRVAGKETSRLQPHVVHLVEQRYQAATVAATVLRLAFNLGDYSTRKDYGLSFQRKTAGKNITLKDLQDSMKPEVTHGGGLWHTAMPMDISYALAKVFSAYGHAVGSALPYPGRESWQTCHYPLLCLASIMIRFLTDIKANKYTYS